MAGTIINLSGDAIVAARVTVCETPWTRVRGLMMKRRLGDDEAYWIRPCNSIHTFFMWIPIDVAFLDKELKVLKLIPEMTPFRVCLPVRNAVSVLEGTVGMIARGKLRKGTQLSYDVEPEALTSP